MKTLSSSLVGLLIYCLTVNVDHAQAANADPPLGSPKFLTAPFKESSITISEGWYYVPEPPLPRSLFCPHPNDIAGGLRHCGIDYSKSGQTFEVVAAAGGRAKRFDNVPDAGTIVVIEHDATDPAGRKFFTRYLHLDPNFPVISSDEFVPINRGDPIGMAGESGLPSGFGIHLHFDVLIGGFNPCSGDPCSVSRVDPYDIAGNLLRAGVEPRREYYPFNEKFTFCGPNFVWTFCPPGPFPSGPLDVFFIVDLSGSFFDDLPSFKAQAPGIIFRLRASNPNTRFGLAKFEDYPIFPFGSAVAGDKAYQRLVDLTFNADIVLNTISGLFTRSGGDGPQSQLPALFQAATGAGQNLSLFPGASIPPGQQANFRNGATKIFMLWTDAPFHRPGDAGVIPYPGPSFVQTVNTIIALDPPKVIGISSGGFGIQDLQEIAAATGSFAPSGGVDCNNDGIIDIPEGESLVCAISSAGAGIGQAIVALVEAAAGVTVEVDIKPGGSPNSINVGNKGVIPVAILTTDNFDATTIDPLSVRFGPSGARETHGRGHIEDVDVDGDLDLVLHFRTQETGILCGDTSSSLTGVTFDGQLIQGSDSVQTVGCKN